MKSSPPDRCPGQISWEYDRTEIIADGVVHAIGVCLGLVGAIAIVAIAAKLDGIDVAPVLVYVIGLVTRLAFSAAYNMWPVSPAKWILRRFDHSAIYLLIAGTYTPFLAQISNTLVSAILGGGVWLSAIIGMALKLALPGRFDRLAMFFACCWDGVASSRTIRSHLRSRAQAYGFSQLVAFSIRSARFSICGSTCVFRTRSGTGLCCWGQVVIIRRSLLSSHGYRECHADHAGRITVSVAAMPQPRRRAAR